MPTVRHHTETRFANDVPGRPARPSTARHGHPIDCVVYRDGVRQQSTLTPEEAVGQVREDGAAFVWIGLHEPDEATLRGLGDLLGLHPPAVDAAVRAGQRPKLDRHADTLLAIFRTVRRLPAGVAAPAPTDPGAHGIAQTGEILVFLGRDFVVTVRHGEYGGLRALRFRLEREPARLAAGPSAVLHAVAERVVSDYLHAAQTLQRAVAAVESTAFTAPAQATQAERIFLLRHETRELRRAVRPIIKPLAMLASEPLHLVPAELREHFGGVADHAAQLGEQLAGHEELLSSIAQANLMRIAAGQREDLRRIAAWAAIIAVPATAAVGYGVNLASMPGPHWPYGYPTLLALAFVACLTLHRSFRRRGWL
ncbi:MAG: magnesium and cobalt transport protein CorA [Actinobacteria bacterium]|nr:magnesium and cobalt transport protein CorA [Actinomycetota bacterium]